MRQVVACRGGAAGCVVFTAASGGSTRRAVNNNKWSAAPPRPALKQASVAAETERLMQRLFSQSFFLMAGILEANYSQPTKQQKSAASRG